MGGSDLQTGATHDSFKRGANLSSWCYRARCLSLHAERLEGQAKKGTEQNCSPSRLDVDIGNCNEAVLLAIASSGLCGMYTDIRGEVYRCVVSHVRLYEIKPNIMQRISSGALP